MPADFTPANEAERTTLETSWAAGALQPHLVRMLEFVDRHRDDIGRLACEQPGPLAVVDAVKRMIAHVGSVHHRSEMADQMRAIHDEIWIRGEKGDYDREFITSEWTSRHAANWRRWRLMEYSFVADHCVGAIDACYRANGHPERRPA